MTFCRLSSFICLHRTRVVSLVLALFGVTAVAAWAAERAAKEADFAKSTIDVGLVVSDAAKAAKFYTEALGFTEIEGFDVPAGLAKDSGLCDGHAFHVRVMVLGEGESATKIKLIEFQGVPSKKVDNSYIHSSLGMRYLTIWVNDTTAAVDRCKKQGVKLLAKSPVALPEGFPQGVFLTVVNDPDGNVIELVGPKK
ncbi:MAG TPA: VOC family protein [Pirellulales bacterium]|nr:VOC family protein [Pirellulales bacterium]